MRRPIRLTIHKDVVEVAFILGSVRWFPVKDLETSRGSIQDRKSGERHRVGELWYQGAGRFHRALRAKSAIMAVDRELTHRAE